MQSFVTLPGRPKINSSFQEIQNSTLRWTQQFKLTPQFKPLQWYSKAGFGLQAAREYPDASFSQLSLAADLLSWLFTVDDSCDRGSDNPEMALEVRDQLHELIAILEHPSAGAKSTLGIALTQILNRFNNISTPFLYRRLCNHIIDYLRECFFEIEMQIDGYFPSIERYYAERPFTGFYIMFPLAGIFENLNLPDDIYLHPSVMELELYISHLGCLSNDLHSVDREVDLEKPGFNLILIAQRELKIEFSAAVEYVRKEHSFYLDRFERARKKLPFWSQEINSQLDKYIQGLYTIVRGYDDWAVVDTGRYESR